MSVYYEVKEHIILKNVDSEKCDCNNVKYDIIETIAQIGYSMLWNHGVVWNLALNADGTNYSFKGREITPELHGILRAIGDAKDIELVLEYDGYNVDFPMLEGVEDMLNEYPEAAENLFYSMYNKADCSNGAGVLVAYGKKDGVLYSGIVEPKEVSAAEDGEWVSEDTVVVFDDEITEEMDVEKIKKCAAAFADMGADVDYEKDEISFYVNYIKLSSVAEVEKFIKIYNELSDATCGRCGYIAEFADKSADEVRIMTIDFNADSTVTIKIAKI